MVVSAIEKGTEVHVSIRNVDGFPEGILFMESPGL